MCDYQPLVDLLNRSECVYTENETLAAHTTFKIGGPADFFIRPANQVMLAAVLYCCRQHDIPYFMLGSGSNVLFSDFGYRGAVISTAGLTDLSMGNGMEIHCGAGVRLSALCSFAAEHSLTGLEFAWGIPGTAGGAVYMNAGAYGGEIRQVLYKSEHLTPDGMEEELAVEQLRLGYRTSIYQKNGCCITGAVFRLKPGNTEEILSHMNELIERRKEKQPLDLPSAGSVFKRPEGQFAGTLIEQSGLKGLTVGGAAVSEKHAGFIVNTGGATSSDVLRLIEKIQDKVFSDSGIRLECELRVVK